MAVRVAFRFPADSEVRYLTKVPRRGERAEGQGREFLVVSRVERDGDGWLIACISPVTYARDARRLSAKLREATHGARERTLAARARTAGLRRKLASS
jgi:hypothetical protein